MAEIFLTRQLSGFKPADEQAERYMRALKIGQTVRAKVVIPRYGAHHRMIFAMLSLTYKNLPERYGSMWPTFESFRKGIAMAVGHIERVVTPDGVIHETPGSLSYDALDQSAFEDVATTMLSVCAKLLEIEEPELSAEVVRAAGLDRWEA